MKLKLFSLIIICILSTFPSLICATNSEYFSFELLFSNIEDSTTINITPIISHIANVLIPFFKIIPPSAYFI